MYCVKCKQKTDSGNVTEVTSKNNRRMLKGICIICGSKKSQFMKNISGRGISDVIGRTIQDLMKSKEDLQSMSPL